jgi:hypothetical protein
MLIPLLSFLIDNKVCSIMMTRLSKEKKEVCRTVALAIYMKKLLSEGTRRMMEIQIFHLAKI